MSGICHWRRQGAKGATATTEKNVWGLYQMIVLRDKWGEAIRAVTAP
jgi:hypothetical protein